MIRHILSIHAHPDDMEILAAGTLAILAEKGHRITVVTMTPGDCGSAEHGADDIAAIRRKEAETAASMIGAAYQCAEFRDLAVFNDDGSRRRVTELIRALRPDVILTSAPTDYHCDHEATSVLVRDACFAVSAPNYKTGVAVPLDAIPHLYYMDSIEGRDRDGNPVRPEFGVNIETYFDKKRAMLAAHASQRNWLLKQHGMDDYLRTMEEWTHYRGQSLGVRYAEGFRQYKHHPYPTSPLLQELVGDSLLR
ncbi:MAG TPA: PIG-L family deacetylase [Bryobacteraceae bacterium]|nr:PIG-L family deacetylase [Bryobacteraceae bacterium]